MSSLADVKIPSPGESISVVYIGRWMKKVGETIQQGESLLEIDSDKASLEVPSPHAGTLKETLFEEGDEVRVGAVIARIDTGGAASGQEAPEPDGGSTAADSRDQDDEKAPEDRPQRPTSPSNAERGEEGAAEPEPEPEPEREAGGEGRRKSGPAARQAAAASGVDIEDVKGSGRDGRVLRGDVEAAASRKPAPAPAPAPAAQAEKKADKKAEGKEAGAGPKREERVRMTPMRRTIARRLVEAQQTAAMLTTFNEVDLTSVMELRKQYQDRFVKRHGLKLGFMSFFIKAAIEALKEFPAVNAEIDGNEIVYKYFYNIGVAVSTERGLMVPIIPDADRLSFAEVEKVIGELAVRARDGKLLPEDFQGGTFTISNGGVFGSLMSTPILNPPQVGILGMHAIQERPVNVGGQIALRPMMYLALSYDHRIIDGREAVQFLVRIKELVEAPERILIEV